MILGVVLVVGAIVYFLWNANPLTDDRTVVFGNSIPGDTRQTFPGLFPRAFNQPEGITYSYAGWLLVKDFTTGYGTKRRIFSKDDAPGLYLDTTSNALMLSVKTFGSTETILISNIPALKWIHFAIVVDQHSVDVYINGILKQHHTLGQLPQQNDALVSAGSGWNGVLARLYYYSRSLNHVEIKALANEPLPSDLERRPSGPQYFDISWYIGRLYSA